MNPGELFLNSPFILILVLDRNTKLRKRVKCTKDVNLHIFIILRFFSVSDATVQFNVPNQSIMSKQFCVNTVVAKIIKDYVQVPTFEELKEEIQHQEYARMKLSTDRMITGYWYAMLYVTTEHVVVQDVLLKVGDTRFGTHLVKLSDWNTYFIEWIDEGHDRYQDCHYEFRNGMRSWGATI